MKKLFFALLLMPLFLTSCRSGGIVLRDTPLGLSDTRVAIVTVIGQPRAMSENGRELFSKYYDATGHPIEKMDLIRRRYTSHIYVLGDQRPYDVKVEVNVEERVDNNHFELVDHDEKRAEDLAEKIHKALNQSRDADRNVIDNFKSF